jgi:hypothetical protein
MSINDRDREYYGEELVNDARRWAREELGGHIARIEGQVMQNTTETNRQRCMAVLDNDPELAGKWRKINQDQKFIEWMNVVDPLYGANRLGGLRQAFDIGASDRCVTIFKSYLASQIPQRMRTETRLPYEDTAKKATVRPSQDRHSERQRIFQPGEIAKFYDDCRRGRYDGREAERLRIEREILAAAAQGRVADSAQQPRMPGRAPWE